MQKLEVLYENNKIYSHIRAQYLKITPEEEVRQENDVIFKGIEQSCYYEGLGKV